MGGFEGRKAAREPSREVKVGRPFKGRLQAMSALIRARAEVSLVATCRDGAAPLLRTSGAAGQPAHDMGAFNT